MNKLLIPPSPNWYEPDIMACAPDNTLIYGSRQDIVVIKSTPENEPDDVQVITKAHSMRIKSVSINRNWGLPHKYAVTVSEDKIVKLWDIESLEKRLSHNKHILLDDNTKVVGASFAGDDRVVSTSESGTIVIWNLTTNETNMLPSLFDAKMTVTCLSVCPHATWLAAFGFKNGLIAVADLRRAGKVLYKMRGHDKTVVSLSWCPAPVNIFPVKPHNKVVEKSLDNNKSVNTDEEKASDANQNSGRKVQHDLDNQEGNAPNERLDNIKKEIVEPINQPLEISKEDKGDRRKQKNPKKAPNPWVDLVHVDDNDSIKTIDIVGKTPNDFLKECADLRQEIVQRSTPKNESKIHASDTEEYVSVQKRVILKPKIKGPKCNISDLLLKKEQALQIGAGVGGSGSVSEEKLEKETVETPTDSRIQNMEISQSLEKLEEKLTDLTEKSMELTCVCDLSKLDTTGSSEESKQFSSVGSCSNDCTCSKKHKGMLEAKKSDTSGTSESGDVFHDAPVCEVKCDKVREICKAEELATFEEQPRKEFLLASSAREPNIYIWRAGTDGRMQSFMTVPPIKNQKKARPDKIWITVCWVAPNILLSSSRGAELLEWTVPKKQPAQGKSFRTVHNDHWSVLFSIKAPISYLNEYNFLQMNEHTSAWTTGMDRAILNTNIRSQKNLGCYYALGGSVNCLSGSPLDPNRLAIGTGEGVLNVWDLSRQHTKRIVFSTFYQKIAASVTALAWHPHIETSLVLATSEGRIVIIDTVGKGKSPKLLPHYFKSQIFKMEWVPLNGDLKNPVLFVVGEAKVAIFDIKSRETQPQLLEMPDDTTVYTMSWKPDYSLLLVSSKSASLISYTPDLKISNISYVRQKLGSIVWNPNAASNDLSVSKYCQTFVSIVKYTELVVYDLSVQSDNHDDKVIARFENRGIIINSIEWNPHVGNQLVFVDDGGVAQVYDIETKSVLSTYVNSSLDPLLSAYWSPIDQDYVITGTMAHKIVVWKVSEHAPLTDKEINTLRNKITKAQSKEVGDQLAKLKLDVAPTQETEGTKPKKSTKSSILPTFYGVNDKTMVQDIRKLLLWKLGDETVEFNVGDNRYVDVLELFDEKNNMERVLDFNISSFRQKGQHQNGNLLSLFKGDIATAVKEAIDQKRVNPWIISMCPMVSPKLWQTACETYADQLRDEPNADPLEIVTYLLACHKVEDSVNVLCERDMFKEALALAKARFGADNALVSEILDKWAKSSAFHGNLEFAAQCYISLGDFKSAAAVLFRRSNVDILELAVELAKLSGDEELHKAVKFRFDAFKVVVEKTEETEVVDKTNKDNGQESSKDVLSEKNGISGEACTSEKSADSSGIMEMTGVEKLGDTSRGQHDESKKDDYTETTMNPLELKQNVTSNKPQKDADSEIPKNDNESSQESAEEQEKDVDNINKLSEASEDLAEKDMVESSCHKNSEEKELESAMKESSEKAESGEAFEKAKELDKDAVKDESNNVHNKKQDNSEGKTEKVLNEKSAIKPKDTVTCDVEFTKKVQELLSDSLMEHGIELDTVAQKVIKSQEGLLSTDEVKELLLTRRMSSGGEDGVKEEKEE